MKQRKTINAQSTNQQGNPTPQPPPGGRRHSAIRRRGGAGSRRSYSARRQGESVGTLIHVMVYLLVVHPLRWVLAKVRGKPAPGMPRYIQKLMNNPER
jgi:hypothetical protein